MGDEIIFASASELGQQIREGLLSAVEVVEAHLARIDAINPTLNAVVTRCDDVARERAAAADTRRERGAPLGPLHGVPFTIKDTFDTAGVRSTAGTVGLADHVPTTNATVVQRLLDAGAILIGKTNTPELTLSYHTDNLLFGKSFNPYDPSRSPGGSSGGSASIVAAGGSAFDVGSDTGGSIRLPAHFCGVAGLKPTAGRIPRTGFVIPCGTPIDELTQVGPIARRVEDLALVLSVLTGPDGRDPSAVPMRNEDPAVVAWSGLRVAYYVENGDASVSAEVESVVRGVAHELADAGARVAQERPPGVEHVRPLFGDLFNSDGGAWVRRVLEDVGTTELSPHLQWVARREDRGASACAAALERLARFRRGMLGFMERYDVIVAPVHPHPARGHDELTGEGRSAGFGYTQAYNLTGWPAATVRAGQSEAGLPIGVQIVARPWAEHVALAVADHVEQALGGWQPPTALERRLP